MARRLRIEPYDPDAIDADNDGIVQEGTAWERPAGARLLGPFDDEIERGLTAEVRPFLRIVDANGVDIDYKPSYGTVTGKAPKKTTLGSLGFPSLSERGSSPFTSLKDSGLVSLDEMVPTIGRMVTPPEREEINVDDAIYEFGRRIDPDRKIAKRGNRERAFKRADEKAKELSWTSGTQYVVETNGEFLVLSSVERDQFVNSLGGAGSIPDSVTITEYAKPKPKVDLTDAKELLESFNGPKKTDIDDALYREHATSLHYLGGAPEDVPDEVFVAAVFDEGIVDATDNPLTNMDGGELTFEDIMTGNFDSSAIDQGTEFSNQRFDFLALKNFAKDMGFGGVWTVFKVTDKQSGETWYVKSSTYGQHEGLLESVGMEIASELGFAVSPGQTDIKTSTPIKVVETPEFYLALGQTTDRSTRWTAMRSIDDWKTSTNFMPQTDIDGDTGVWFDAGKASKGFDQATVDEGDVARILVFDFVLDQLDRHEGNFKVANDWNNWQRLGVIDNGLLFGGRIRDFPEFSSISHEQEATPEQMLQHAQDRASLSLADYALGDKGTVLISSLGKFASRMKTDIFGRQREKFDEEWKRTIEKIEESLERTLSVERFTERGITLTPTEIAHLEGMRTVARARLQSLKDNPQAFDEAMDAIEQKQRQVAQGAAMGMASFAKVMGVPTPIPEPMTPEETWS